MYEYINGLGFLTRINAFGDNLKDLLLISL